jgi:NitT/TauT family transport system substrate-binding protein
LLTSPFTPLTADAICAALARLSAESTVPESVTMPLSLLTLIFKKFEGESAVSLAITSAAMRASSMNSPTVRACAVMTPPTASASSAASASDARRGHSPLMAARCCNPMANDLEWAAMNAPSRVPTSVVSMLCLILLFVSSLPFPLAATGRTRIRVGTCARTLTAGVGSQFAVATKMGWFAREGLDVEVVPLTGSTDCVKFVATREFLMTLPSMEPLAIGRQQGVRIKNFYTAYQTPGYAIAVPADSPIQKITDLRGKTIGVTNMASAGVIIARALAAASGLNPDTDINIVVAGEGAQPAALLRSKQIDALSQFDTQYALIENVGLKLRILDKRPIERFPSNGFIALEETIQSRAKELAGFGRAYAKGTIFTIVNPEAAVRMLYEVFPFTRPTGKDEATAIREDVHVLRARIPQLKLEPAGVRRWGETNETNLREYMDFLLKWGVLKQRVEAADLMTNELIGEINRFDADAIAKTAREYKAR